MMIFTVASDFLLYIAFSFIAGSIVLEFVSVSKKPILFQSNRFLLWSIAGIIVFSAAPVIELWFFLAEFQGWGQSLVDVLTSYRAGQGWLLLLLFSIILGFLIVLRVSKYLQALFVLLIAVTVGFYSHVSTLDLWVGSISHSIHFLAMGLWTGVLLHVAWLSKGGANWKGFFKWFTPFAIVAVTAVIASGIVLMFFFVEPAEYADSWVVPYGQTLLLKHLIFIPLLVAALANGFMNKRGGVEKTWLRTESLLMLIVFGLTAFMSKQAPPHNINETLRIEGTAPILNLLKGDQYIPVNAGLDVNMNGVIVMAFSIILLAAFFIGLARKLSISLMVLLGIGFAVCFYIGLMLNLTF